MDEFLKGAITVLAAAVGAAFAAYFGAVFGARKFRNEKAFEQRLDWYKRCAAALTKFSFDIEVALTYQREGSDASGNWVVVREHGYIPLTILVAESKLFATPAGVRVMEEIGRHLDGVSDFTDCFEPIALRGDPQKLDRVSGLKTKAAEALDALTTDMRMHLGFEKIS